MNETLVVLAIVTQAGMINQDLKFSTMEQCEQARSNIKHMESFCYQPPEVDMNATIDQMGDVLKRMKEALERATAETDEDPTPTL